MGLIANILGAVGSGRVRETIEVFRPNAEAADARGHDQFIAALEQFAAERSGAGWFDRLVDGLNRLPRPALAFGTIGLFVFAMADPESFSVRITALALIPDQLWWLLGAIVSFYFGARELQKVRADSVAQTMATLAEWRAGTAATRAEIAARDPGPDAAPAPSPSLANLPAVPISAPPEGANLIDFAVLDANPALLEASHDG